LTPARPLRQQRPTLQSVHVFLSHNADDKHLAEPVAAQLRLVGADVWLDDWEIKPGDSVPGKVNDALAAVDTVVILWSANAAASRWVGAELETALARRIADDDLRVIPVRLDETDLPPLLRPLKWLTLHEADDDVRRVVQSIAGLPTAEAFLKAVQQQIEEAGLEFRYFEGYGVAVACPRCGAPASELEGWSAVDDSRDDTYAGARCTSCRWEDGGEIW
jgi:hypothetical protein